MTKKELEEKVKRLEAEVELLKLKIEILEKYPKINIDPFKQPEPLLPWPAIPYIPPMFPYPYDITYPFPPKIWYSNKTEIDNL